MKLNVWGINYHPEPIGISVYTTRLCEHMAEAGHEVSVTTAFPYYPSWTCDPDYKGKIWTDDCINGLQVHRNCLYIPNKPTVLRRIAHELSFVALSFVRQLFLPAPDLYLVVSPPLLLGVAAWILCLIKRRQFIFHVQDLQPDAAIALGMIKYKWLVSVLLFAERMAYKHAARVSVISEQMRQTLLGKGVEPGKIEVLPNAVRLNEELPPPGTFKKKYGIDENVQIVSYSGNLGVKQGLNTVVSAAEILAAKHPAQFVICGDGAAKASLHRHIKDANLNVLLLNVLPLDDYLALLADSAVCLVTLKPGTGASFLPSKLLNILAAGRPVITNADANSALCQAVKEGRFGVVCNDGGNFLAEAILSTLSSSETCQAMSTAARQYVRQFEESHILKRWEKFLVITAGQTVQPVRQTVTDE